MFRAAVALFLVATATVVATAQQHARWRLVEEWRVGGAATGAHSFLDVRDIELLSNGGLLILDSKDQQIHFLDARGAPMRTVGRKGEGPGEFQRANGFAVAPNGQIVVNDPGNSRFTVLSPTGDFVRTIPMQFWGYGFVWDGRFNGTGRLEEVIRVRDAPTAPNRSARRVWSTDLARADTSAIAACPSATPPPVAADVTFTLTGAGGTATTMMTIPFIRPPYPIVTASDGTTWFGMPPDFRRIIRRTADSCADAATIELRGPRLPVPERKRAETIEGIRKHAAEIGAAFPDFEKIPRQLPYYEAVRLDRTARLWVERATATDGRIFEVFSPTGALLAEAEGAVPIESSQIVVITNDRIYAFTRDADGLAYLVALRIQR